MAVILTYSQHTTEINETTTFSVDYDMQDVPEYYKFDSKDAHWQGDQDNKELRKEPSKNFGWGSPDSPHGVMYIPLNVYSN